MALATYQLQGSCSTFLSMPSSRSRGSTLNHSVLKLHAVRSKHRVISLKCRLYSSVGTSLVHGPKKVLRILAFKGNNGYDDSGVNANGLKKNGVKLSYLQNTSEESSLESLKGHNAVPAPCTAADENAARSLAIQNTFKNWLMLLRKPSPSQAVEEIIEEPYSREISERLNASQTQLNASQTQERGDILKAVSCYFLEMDATIKIPLIIFAPLYLAVNLVYGSKVSKELAPLWIVGPVLVAFYIKIFQAVSGLYAFSFKQTAKVVKSVPVLYSLVCDYVVHGKLKEALNINYNEVAKDFQNWWVERYLDFIESAWPRYSKTLRFLKKSNLI